MLQRIAGTASVCLVALVATAVVFDSAGGAITQGKSRPAETKYLMRGVVQPNCAAIGKMLKEGALRMTRPGTPSPVTRVC